MIAFGVAPLIASFAVMLVVAMVAITEVASRFSALGEERSAALSSQLRENSAKARAKTTDFLEEGLRRKGTTLVRKDALALTPAYLENSVLGVRDFLADTMKFDEEIVEADFFVLTGGPTGEIKAWQYLRRGLEDRIGLRVTFDRTKNAWLTDVDGKETAFADPRLTEILNLKEPSLAPVDFEMTDASGKTRKIQALDAVTPIRDPARPDTVAFLRYVLTRENLVKALASEEDQLKSALDRQQQLEQEAIQHGESIKASVKGWTLVSLLAAALLVLAGAVAASLVTSRRLTDPILALTESAHRIADGNFDVPVAASGPSEIEDLGRSFDTMRVHVKDYQSRLLTILSSTRALAMCRQVAEAVGTAAGFMGQSHVFQAGATTGAEVQMLLFCDDHGRLGTTDRATLRDVKLAVFRQDGASAQDPRFKTLDTPDETDVLAALADTRPQLSGTDGSLLVPISTGRKHYGYLRFSPYQKGELQAEDADFLQAIASALAIALDNIAFLRESEERVRVQSEMEAAKVLQHSLLPGDITFPGVDLAYLYQAAAQTGGDWLGCQYDRVNHRLELCIGDVTGHGFPSALLTGVVCGAIYSGSHLCNLLERHRDPAERLIAIARVANRIVYDTGRRKQMMTMIFMSLDLSTGELFYMNAGHNPFFHLRADTKQAESHLDAFGILGFTEHPTYTVKSLKLNPGDALFLHTDGLVENTGPEEKDVLNFRKLKKSLTFGQPARDTLDGIMTAANGVWQGTPPNDDVTALVVHWKQAVTRAEVEEIIGTDSLHNLVAVSRGVHEKTTTSGATPNAQPAPKRVA